MNDRLSEEIQRLERMVKVQHEECSNVPMRDLPASKELSKLRLAITMNEMIPRGLIYKYEGDNAYH